MGREGKGREGKGFILFSIMFTLALGHIQSTIQWLLGAISPG
jgi:hypothetical protein